MEDISQLQLLFLCCMALLAGLVDSMVGGGGLIQVPALFNALPAALPGTLFGTNKLSAIAGTATACWRYARTVRINWAIAGPASLAALLCAFLGAKLVSWLPVAAVRPLVLVLLVLMALYTMRQKQLGMVHAPLQDRRIIRWRALAMGASIGFYDGFFGPGTGSFLLFACVRWFGCDFACIGDCQSGESGHQSGGVGVFHTQRQCAVSDRRADGIVQHPWRTDRQPPGAARRGAPGARIVFAAGVGADHSFGI